MKPFYSFFLKSATSCLLFFSFTLNCGAQVGSVLDFDGVDDYVNLGTTALKPTTGLTAEVWINMATWGGTQTFLGNTQASGYAIFMQAGELRGIVLRNGAYGIVSIPAASITAGWHHIALTFDGQFTRLYLDANLVSTNDAGGVYPITYIANNTYFGAEANTALSLFPEAGYYFQGQMDEVRIWNYARSQCQIYTFKGCEIPTSAPGLLGNYHFNQGISGAFNILTFILNDASGNLNTGALNNFALNLGTSNWLSPGPFSNGFATPAPTPTVTTGQEYSVTITIPNGQTNVSDWTPWVTTFTNPLPGGAIVTGMNLQLDGVDQGWGGTGHPAAFYAGGEFVGNAVFLHSLQSFSIQTTKPFPYYNYGGVNTFSFYFAGYPGWQGFISNVSLTIRYQLLNTLPITVCQNSTTVLNGLGAGSYTWSGGVTNGVPFVVTASQNYTVTGQVFGCLSSNTVQVNAIPAPTITSITGGTFLCEGSAITVSMNTTGAVSNYSWSSGALTSSAIVSPVLNTTYTATATNTAGCSHTATTAITVGALPVLSVNSGSICSGNVFTIVPSGGVTYTYSSGSNTVSPLVNFSYLVTGTDAMGCVSLPVISDVTVRATPTVAVNSGTVCFGQSFTITPTGALSFTYLTGSTIVTPTASTSYSVIGASAFGCPSSNTAVSSVAVNTLPIVSISTPTAATCNGGSITLTASGADTFTWTGGIGNGVAFVPAASGNYSVNGTNTLTGCTGTNNASIAVTVYSLPSISIPNYTLCSGNSITLVPSGAATYTYSSGSPLVNPTVLSTYSVSGTSTAGCISALPAVATVTVHATPTVAVNSGTICFGQNFTITPSGALSYTYLTGSTIVTPSVSTSYSVIGASVFGCASSNTAISSIVVNTLPIVSISTSTAATCNGGPITLTASGADTFTWTGGISNGVAFIPAASGNYSVNGTNTLTGCTGTNNAAIAVTVYALPVISVPNYTLCSGNSTTLVPTGANTYTYSSGSSIVNPMVLSTYSVSGTSTAGCISSFPAVSTVSVFITPTLSVNSGSICAGQNFTILPSGASTYTISGGSFLVNPLISNDYTLTGTSVNGCAAASSAISSLTVHALPIVAISTSSNALCSGGSVSLTASNAATYTWSPGTFTTSVLNASPIINTTYTLAGTSTAGCTSTNAPIQAITVYSLPVLSTGTPSTAICFGANASPSVTGAFTYTWQPGNLTGSSIVVSPASTINYTVSGSSVFGCLSSNTLLSSVVVNTLPVLGLSASQPAICFGESTTLTASGANIYTLNPGALIGTSFTLNPNVNTPYSLSGTNTLTGCSSNSIALITITVHPLPVVSITSNTNVLCFGQSANLSAGNAATYTWQPGTFVGQNFTVTPNASTTYTLFGTNAQGCTNTNVAVQSITVLSLPVVSASASPAVICIGNTLALIGSGADTYTWSGGVLNGVAFAPIISSTYTLNGTNTLTGCSSTNSAVQNITINPLPNITVNSATTAVCIGFSTSLSGAGAITYTWSGGITDAVAFQPVSTQQYTVTGTSALGCTNIATQDVTVYPLPVVSANASQTVLCFGESLTLSGSGADTYTWTPAINNAISFTPVASATYSVVGTNTLTGCSSTNTATQFILVNSLPVVSASVSNAVICAGFTTMLSGIGANSYSWTGGVINATAFSPSSTASYSVTGTDLNGCNNYAVGSVSVNPLPVLMVSSANPLTCSGETTTLSASGAITYTWNTGASTTTIPVTLNTSTSFTLSGTDGNNCQNAVAYVQQVDPCTGIVEIVPEIKNVTCNNRKDGEIELTNKISYSQNKVYYFWSTPELCADSSCNSLRKLASGNYFVRVRVEYTLSPTYAKVDTLDFTITVEDNNPPCPLTVYNGLTLNGDGINDLFYIENIQSFKNNKVSVFNRWGEKMAEISNYNNSDKVWPLGNELEKLISGTYFYIIDRGDGSELEKGWLEVFKN